MTNRTAYFSFQILLLSLFVLGTNASETQQGRNFQAVFKKTPTPFTIDVDSDFIDYTKQKVALTRFPEAIQQPVLEEGPSIHNASAVKEHWVNHYDWFKVQEALNEE